MTAIERFRRWATERIDAGETKTAVAQRIGVNPSLITKLLQGERSRVSGRVAFAIEAATASWEHGPIPAADWYEAA